MFKRISVTVCVTALAGVLVLLGVFLTLQGMAMLPGVLLVGTHLVRVATILILLGFVSLTTAGLLCFGLFGMVQNVPFWGNRLRIGSVVF